MSGQLILDVHHEYAGYHGAPSICRIRIYETVIRPPVVVCTEIGENEGTSVTNAAEFIAAEVLQKYLPHRQGADLPFLWIEHYPPEGTLPRRHDGIGDLDLVTFGSYTPLQVQAGRRWRYSLGDPSWQPLKLEDAERLIGQPFPRTERVAVAR